jgi:nucleotide-binding universal stress UspA family protein
MAYKRIVLATDGSRTAETAEQVAAALARTTKGSITVVHAYEDPTRAEPAVARALRIAQEQGAKASPVLSPEEPADAVIEAAVRRDADLVVTGSRGLFRQEQVFGSVVKKVAVNAPCDVLLTRPRDDSSWPTDAPPYRRILIATDGSVTADRAARKGYALAKRLGAGVSLVFVGHPKTGELIVEDTIATMGGEVEHTDRVLLEGDPAEEIMRAADKQSADLIVVGNRGMTGARAVLLGSVPMTVAEYALKDVLIARTIAQNLDEIVPGEGGIVATGDHKVAVYRDPSGAVHAMSARCTHMGCIVRWNPAESTWDCPCHGSRFAATGEVLNGPAARALEPTDL